MNNRRRRYFEGRRNAKICPVFLLVVSDIISREFVMMQYIAVAGSGHFVRSKELMDTVFVLLENGRTSQLENGPDKMSQP